MQVLIFGRAGALRTFIEKQLLERGHEAGTYEDATEALAAFEALRPWWVVLAPCNRAGLDLGRAVKENYGQAAVILAVVEEGAEVTAEDILAAQIDDCIYESDAGIEARLRFVEQRVLKRGERNEIEEALRKSEGKFRRLAENIPGVIYLSEPREPYVMLFVNDAIEQLTGYAKEEFLSGQVGYRDLIFPEDRPKATWRVEQAIERHEPFKLQYRIRHRSGESRWVGETGVEVLDSGGVVRLEGYLSDVTEQKKAVKALLENENRTRAILETTVDAIVTIDSSGAITSFNRAAEEIFGYKAGEVLGENVSILMPSPFREEHDGYMRSYEETGHRRIIGIGREVAGLRKDGTTFPLDLAVSEVVHDGERTYTGIIRDISERRRLEQEILRVSEQERRRIGQDLHDGLGQMLTGIGLISKNLAQKLEMEGIEAASDVAEIADLVKEADQQARSLARGLVPVDFHSDGLSTAIARLTTNAERLFGITCTFEEVGDQRVQDNNVAMHLYRIVQEAVSNAAKHGRATTVRVTLAYGQDQIRLRIQDNGVGIGRAESSGTGMGVRIMHHRARIIGGVLKVRLAPSGGTIVTCTLPLNANYVMNQGSK